MAETRVFARPPKKIGEMSDEERRAFARLIVERLAATVPAEAKGAADPDA